MTQSSHVRPQVKEGTYCSAVSRAAEQRPHGASGAVLSSQPQPCADSARRARRAGATPSQARLLTGTPSTLYCAGREAMNGLSPDRPCLLIPTGRHRYPGPRGCSSLRQNPDRRSLRGRAAPQPGAGVGGGRGVKNCACVRPFKVEKVPSLDKAIGEDCGLRLSGTLCSLGCLLNQLGTG